MGGKYQQVLRCLLLTPSPDRLAEIRGKEWLVKEGLDRDFFDGSVEAVRLLRRLHYPEEAGEILCTYATDGVYVAPGCAVTAELNPSSDLVLGSPAGTRAMREAAIGDEGTFLLLVSELPLVRCIHVTMVMSWSGRMRSFPILLQGSTSGAITAPICAGIETVKRVGEGAGLRCAAMARDGDRYWDKILKLTVKRLLKLFSGRETDRAHREVIRLLLQLPPGDMHFWDSWHLLKNDRSYKVKVREGRWEAATAAQTDRVDVRGWLASMLNDDGCPHRVLSKLVTIH
jgi:hypothetical protein